MKQIIVTIFCLLFFYSTDAQQLIDLCGIDNAAIIDTSEAEFLNDYYRDRGSFDFSAKKIAFVTGGGASIISSKNEFFNHVKQWKDNHNTTIETRLVVLNSQEKEMSGGYDAIILFWVKFFSKGQRQKILGRLGAGEVPANQ